MESSSNRVLFEIKEVPENKSNVNYILNNNIIYEIYLYSLLHFIKNLKKK